jgi:hypothetical protein
MGRGRGAGIKYIPGGELFEQSQECPVSNMKFLGSGALDTSLKHKHVFYLKHEAAAFETSRLCKVNELDNGKSPGVFL